MSWDDLIKQAEEAGLAFDPVPGGAYELEVVKSDPVISSSGKPMVKLRFKIVDGPFVGKLLYDQIVFSRDNQNALAFFFRNLGAFGLGKDFFAQCPPPEQGGIAKIASALMGRRVLSTVGVREWPANSGQFRNEVTGYAPSRGAAQAAPTVGGIAGVAPPRTQVAQPAQASLPPQPESVAQPVAVEPTPQPQPPQPQPQEEPVTAGTPPKVPF